MHVYKQVETLKSTDIKKIYSVFSIALFLLYIQACFCMTSSQIWINMVLCQSVWMGIKHPSCVQQADAASHSESDT